MENGRKKMRFEVLLERYFTNFHRILLTNLLFAIPSAAVFAIEYILYKFVFHSIIIPIAIMAIIPLYPFYAGVVKVCRNIARGDEDVHVASCFFDAVRINFPRFLLHGVMVYIASMLSFFAIYLYSSLLSNGWFFYLLLFFGIVIALFLLYASFYLPLMDITYDLPLRYVYKNSLLMSFGEFKNNLFATFALAIVCGIVFTVIVFIKSPIAFLIVIAALWILLFPATCTFMYVFYIYDGMTSIIQSKDERSREISDSIQSKLDQKKDNPSVQAEEEDFSDIDISSLKDTDDYIFHNGRMVKQSTILRMIREREQQENDKDQ